MEKDLQRNPEEFWEKTLDQWKRTIGFQAPATPLQDLDQNDKDATIGQSLAAVGQLVKFTSAAIDPVVRISSTHVLCWLMFI